MKTSDLIKQGQSAFSGGSGNLNTYTLPIEFTALDEDSTIEEVLSILGGDLEAETLIDNLNADKTASLCFQSISSFDNSYGSQKHTDTTTPINYVSDFVNIKIAGLPSTKSLEISFIDPYYIPSERSIRIKTMKVSLKVTPSSVEGEPDTREWNYSYSELASFYHSGTIPQIARLPMTLLTLENGLTSEELLLFINPNNTLQDSVESIVLSLNGSLATGTLIYPLVIFMSKDSKTIPFTYTNCTEVDWENRDSSNRPIPFYPCHLELEYTHENIHFRGVFDKETAGSDWIYNVERTSLGGDLSITRQPLVGQIVPHIGNEDGTFTSAAPWTVYTTAENLWSQVYSSDPRIRNYVYNGRAPNEIENIDYSWDFNTNTYAVGTEHLAGAAIGNITIASTYNDGIHGELPITIIKENAFNGNTELTGVTLPEGLTTIETGAFSGCPNLGEINIPDTVLVIANGAFNE